MTKSMNCDPIQSHYIGGVVEDLSYEFLINLEDRLLGSAGKKNISGDIDIAVTEEEFESLLKQTEHYGDKRQVVANTLSIPFTYEIGIQVDQTRRVQVDFMKCDNIDAAKLFYHAPKHSNYSGEMRTILAMIVFGCIEKVFQRYDDDGELIGFRTLSFSPKTGLTRVTRERVPRKDGKGYTKKWQNTALFLKPKRQTRETIYLDWQIDVDSFESIFWSVKQNYAKHLPEIIRKFRERKETQHIRPIEFDWYEEKIK